MTGVTTVTFTNLALDGGGGGGAQLGINGHDVRNLNIVNSTVTGTSDAAGKGPSCGI